MTLQPVPVSGVLLPIDGLYPPSPVRWSCACHVASASGHRLRACSLEPPTLCLLPQMRLMLYARPTVASTRLACHTSHVPANARPTRPDPPQTEAPLPARIKNQGTNPIPPPPQRPPSTTCPRRCAGLNRLTTSGKGPAPRSHPRHPRPAQIKDRGTNPIPLPPRNPPTPRHLLSSPAATVTAPVRTMQPPPHVVRHCSTLPADENVTIARRRDPLGSGSTPATRPQSSYATIRPQS